MFYRCKDCGGNAVYDPKKKKMVCESCGNEETQEKIPQEKTISFPISVRISCANCLARDGVIAISPSLGMTPMFMDSLEILPNCFGGTERLCPPNSILHSGTGYCI